MRLKYVNARTMPKLTSNVHSMREDKVGRTKVNEICFPRMITLTRYFLSQSNGSLWIWGKCDASVELYAYSFRIVSGCREGTIG